MKKSSNPLFTLISIVKDTAISSVNHKLWTMHKVIKNRHAFFDSLDNHEDTVKTDSEPYSPKRHELTPEDRVVQAFLTSSRLEGYIEPFMELEIIRQTPDPKQIAAIFNHAMCIIRYLCKGDAIFCKGALSMMLDELRICMENDQMADFTVSRALSTGACAMESEVFKKQFIHRPYEQWKHAYIIGVNSEVSFDDFMGMLQSMFATLNYTCPDFPHLIKHEDHLGDWVADINGILDPLDLKLVQIENDYISSCLFVLLKRFECNVLNGMMAEAGCK